MRSNVLGLRGRRRINDYPWYPLLVPPRLTYRCPDGSPSSSSSSSGKIIGMSLLDDFDPSKLKDGSLLVCLTGKEEDDRESRNYSAFISPKVFLDYYSNFPAEERCFYETIHGSFAQKPHFDIDFDRDDLQYFKEIEGVERSKKLKNTVDAVVSGTIRSILEEFNELGLPLDPSKDILLFSSCDEENDKYSYHIVIDHYSHNNNREAAAFYQRVTMRLPPEWSQRGWIDPKVYSSKQNFRMIGSTKLGKRRFKELLDQWYHPISGSIVKYWIDESIPNWTQSRFESSLVSYTANCTPLPPFTSPEKDKPKYWNRDSQEEIEVTLEEAKKALEIIAIHAKVSPNCYLFPFKIIEIRSPIVVLKRLRPSNCRICNKTHEKENPFLLIVGKERSVYFDCRRSNKSLCIGSLGDSLALLWAKNVVLPDGEPALYDSNIEPKDMSPESTLQDLNLIASTTKPKLVNGKLEIPLTLKAQAKLERRGAKEFRNSYQAIMWKT